MKILIATGIFPPEIGGPAKYAKSLMDEFTKRGFEVVVLSYGIEKKLPIIARHIFYFFKIVFNLSKTDLIIALDMLSTGFPAALAAKIFKKKIILRVGGDFLWETYIEKTGHLISLKDFYKQEPKLPLKHKIISRLQKFTLLNSSAVAFNSSWQKDFFEKIYKLDSAKTFVIENFYGRKIESYEPEKKNFLFAGRKIKFKNLELLKEVFEELQKENKELKLEITDNLPQGELEEKVKNSYALILPSITDFAPNFIIEGVSANKPFILTKNCGLFDKFHGIGIFVDPFNKEEIKNKVLFLVKEENYNEYKKRIANFNFTHSWKEIVDEFLNIYKSL